MSNRSRRAADRAEARRRARYTALGRTDAAESDEEAEAPSSEPARRPGGTFLTRLFPPAPPLPGKPDPLAGYTYEGPLRGVVSGFYLLSRHPIPWLAFGALWAIARLALVPGSVLAIVASLLAFGSLIAAGWVGWARPWLFGLMASVVGILAYGGMVYFLVAGDPGSEITAGEAFLRSVYWEVVGFQPLFGALAGWYGGYLRRRMAATSASGRQQSARRR